MQNKKMTILLASTLTVAGLAAVGGAALAAASDTSAPAALPASTTMPAVLQVVDDSTVPPAPNMGGGMMGDGDRDGNRDDSAAIADRIRQQLQGLVDKGTINATQADAVAQELATTMPGRPGMGHDGPGMHGPGMHGPGLDAAAKALGTTVDKVAAGLQSGKSLADLAKAAGVDKQKVIDALVAEAKAHLAEEVTEGDLTQAQADQQLADLTTRITAMVDAAGGAPLR